MFYGGSAWIWIVAAFPNLAKNFKKFSDPVNFCPLVSPIIEGTSPQEKYRRFLYMEKLVRVIKLRPGESVLIIAEEHPAPCPYGGFCTAPKHENEFSQSKGILVYIDGAA